MAYVRTKGNQLAVVHGVRDPETRKVEQKTLFTIYSKAEALAAVGSSSHYFQDILEEQNPGVRFDWNKVAGGIRDNLHHLPDLYSYKKARLQDGFRTALVGFSRELMLADPQSLSSSARLLQDNRHELEYLRDLIEWRLKLCSEEPDDFNKDNPFYWGAMSRRREVGPEEHERLDALYGAGKYGEAEALARLLVEAWPNFAAGYNHLGLLAIKRDDLSDAVDCFDDAIRVGRTLFPKRMPKDRWWSDHDTRPYIRALLHKARVLNVQGDYVGALQVCERLEKECHQDVAAADARVPILLNSGNWKEARAAALYVHNMFPQQNLLLAFALFELGDLPEAVLQFIRGSVHFPISANMLATGEARAPQTHDEADDYTAGVDTLWELEAYFGQTGPEVNGFFGDIVESEPYEAMLAEYALAQEAWRDHRGGGHGAAYDKMMRMQSDDWAREKAAELAVVLGL